LKTRVGRGFPFLGGTHRANSSKQTKTSIGFKNTLHPNDTANKTKAAAKGKTLKST